MAQSFQTDSGKLVIPGAYNQFKVESANSGLATTGILMLVGEADAGADFSQETDLNANSFGPDQLAEVQAKYKSGNLVDAFRAACAPANDPDIQGSFFRAVLVKTNVSGKGSSTLKKFDGSSYGTIQDRSYGKLGNLITKSVTTKTAEVVPTTGAFAFLPPIASTNLSVRVNGGAATTITASAQMTPTAFASALNAVAGVDVTGGEDLNVMGTAGTPLAGNLVVTKLAGNNITVTFSVNFGAIPAVGSTMWIPAASAVAGVGSANAGAYVVTGASAGSITGRKLLDASGTPNQLTVPVAVGSTAATSNDDLFCYSAITAFLVAADPVAGLGKTLEINELTSGVGLLSYLCYTMGATNPAAVTWISTTAAPKVINSASEYAVTLSTGRQVDSISEDISEGGKIALLISYTGTTASLVNDGTNLTITVVGGAGVSPGAIALADYPTIASLSQYIGSLTGFKAAPGTNVLGQQPSTSLDQGTFTIGSTFGGYTGRIKQDAYKFFNTVASDSALVEMAAQATAGLPAPEALGFMSGGTKGATTDAGYNAAIDALEIVRGNFVVPLFSRDAADNVADNLTDANSTYTIANIHAYTKSHCLRMSTLKRKRNRQTVLSVRGTFTSGKEVASNIAFYRACVTFQDAKDSGSNGIVQFHPWMMAVKAAATQAAGFYRPIVRKGINISGALQAAGDFNDQNDTQMEDALLSGLLPVRRDENGGWYWVSDQSTYGKDSNFVFNSLQATYVADTIVLTVAQRMEKAFVGQSVADISASMALSTLEAIMEDLKRLKLISASDDAPKGYKNAKIKITGGAMEVSLEVKLAGAIYFIPIMTSISQVQQSAG